MSVWPTVLWPRREDSVTQESHGGTASAPSSAERTTADDAAVIPAGDTAAAGPGATAAEDVTVSPAAVSTGATVAAVGAVKPAGTGRPMPGSVLIASKAKPATVGVPPRPSGADFPCAATSDEDWKYFAMVPFGDGGGRLPRAETWRYRH